MEPKREQAFVGLFVIVAVGILIATMVAIGGVFATASNIYHAYFAFAGGLEQGFGVRYAGGPKVGRIESLRIDPQNPTRLEVTFSVATGVPVKTDSHVSIMSISPLGDNHLEILPGSAAAQRAPNGSTLTADPYIGLNDLTASLNALAPQAKQLLTTFNDRAVELKVTLARVNDLLNDRNRENISGALATTRGMLDENRPKLRSTLNHLDTVTAKLDPLLDDFKKTTAKANQTLDHLDATLTENRPDIHKAILQMRETLRAADDLVGRLNTTLDANSENIDELLENLRAVTENLKEFTDTIKTRPYSLIRITNPRDHQPGEQH